MGWPASPGLWRWREARCRGWHGTHCTEMTPDTGTHNTAGHGKAGGGAGQDGDDSGGHGGWNGSSISPQRQEGCTTKAVDTGTEKGH